MITIYNDCDIANVPEGAVYVGKGSEWESPFGDGYVEFHNWIEHGEIALSSLTDDTLFPWTPKSKDRLAEKRDWFIRNIPWLRGKAIASNYKFAESSYVDALIGFANSMKDDMPPLTVELPKKPSELWGLWTDKKDWLPPIDVAGSPIIVFTSEENAIVGAADQERLYEVKSVPVRIY